MTPLSELLRLQEEATPGPWESSVSDWHTDKVFHGPQIVVQSCMDSAESEANMEFIAAARNFDFASLQAQYEAMREWIANKKYVTHLNECYSYNEEGEGTPITCTCGLSSLDTKARGDGDGLQASA